VRRPEQRLWDRLRKAAAGRVHTERIENLVGVGRPDVDTLVSGSFVPVELKAIADWPAKAATKVLGRSGLSQVQKNWHLNWRRWGGRSLIVVEVKDEVFTFNGSTADHVNDYNTRNFRSAAMVVGIEATVDLLVGLSQKGKDED
jgi:hypothetical protein